MPRSLHSDAYKVLIEELVKARGAQRLRQADLARRTGKPQSFISKVERGERRIDLVEFCLLAEGLGMDPVILFQSIVEKLPHPLAPELNVDR